MKQGTVLVKGRRSCHLRKKRGTVLVEVLLAATLLAIILVPVLNFLVTGIETNWFASYEVKAQALARESLEALRSVRERNWDELTEGTFYATPSAGVWQLVPSSEGETIGPFNRRIEIGPVHRDDQGDIVETGGWLDPSTKAVTATLSWHSLRDRTISLATYLTRYLKNLVWRQTTKEEFEQGEMEMVKTLDPPQDDGEVVLEGGCPSGSPESLIYDDELRNGWRVDCDGLPFWEWLVCVLLSFFNNAEVDTESSDYTYDESLYSIKIDLKASGWSWIKLHNYDGVCTTGFKNIHFYAYNPSGEEIELYLTARYQEWETAKITLPPQDWQEISIDYETLEEYENNLKALYFHKWIDSGDPDVVFYVDQIELTGGVGGYFTQGTLTSSVLDAGQETAFNRIAHQADTPEQTSVGFQAATASNPDGPWLFYGPGGTTSESDLYTNPAGEGIWLGNNLGRYLRYKAYLFSDDGVTTPVLYEVSINYSP